MPTWGEKESNRERADLESLRALIRAAWELPFLNQAYLDIETIAA
jgi:hypothetical protein